MAIKLDAHSLRQQRARAEDLRRLVNVYHAAERWPNLASIQAIVDSELLGTVAPDAKPIDEIVTARSAPLAPAASLARSRALLDALAGTAAGGRAGLGVVRDRQAALRESEGLHDQLYASRQ